jgi:hypothetical protein
MWTLALSPGMEMSPAQASPHGKRAQWKTIFVDKKLLVKIERVHTKRHNQEYMEQPRRTECDNQHDCEVPWRGERLTRQTARPKGRQNDRQQDKQTEIHPHRRRREKHKSKTIERQTDRQKDSQPDRQTDSQTGRETDRPPERQTIVK